MTRYLRPLLAAALAAGVSLGATPQVHATTSALASNAGARYSASRNFREHQGRTQQDQRRREGSQLRQAVEVRSQEATSPASREDGLQRTHQ